MQGIADERDRSEGNPNGDLQATQAGIEQNRPPECLSTLAMVVAVAVVMMFQSTLASRDMMVSALPALPSSAQALPCPLSAGWELIENVALSHKALDGDPVGGFSAVAYQRDQDRLWLLSDATSGYLVSVEGLGRLIRAEQGSLPAGRRLLLLDQRGSPLPMNFDGEGLVLVGDQAWIVSEGRRSHERRASLQRFNLSDGRLERNVPMLQAWQEAEGQGLASNKGPEALTQMPNGDLLMAAEAPLIQDRAHRGRDWVRLARFRPGSDLRPEPLGGVEIGPEGAAARQKLGLTELLAVGNDSLVLALMRSFAFPLGWSAHLRILQLPQVDSASAPPIQPLHSWDLLADGLPAANWEGMTWGPAMSDGRIPLLLVSDDGFNPLKTSWLSVLAPRRSPDCEPDRFSF